MWTAPALAEDRGEMDAQPLQAGTSNDHIVYRIDVGLIGLQAIKFIEAPHNWVYWSSFGSMVRRVGIRVHLIGSSLFLFAAEQVRFTAARV